MATPKKKISRSRRNMRRFSCAYKIDPVANTVNSDGVQVRTHTVTLESIGAYIEARKARKAARKTTAAKA
jgi:ribosomal protein L32